MKSSIISSINLQHRIPIIKVHNIEQQHTQSTASNTNNPQSSAGQFRASDIHNSSLIRDAQGAGKKSSLSPEREADGSVKSK